MSLARKSSRPHVVIVGCGFAGLEAARRLGGSDVRLTLVDRGAEFVFRPLLSQLLAGRVRLTSVAHPLRGFARSFPGATFQQGTLERIEAGARQISLSGQPMRYDYLILATGGNPLSRDALGPPRGLRLDNLEDWRTLDRALVQAALGPKAAGRHEQRSIVVVGGGPHGVELAAALETRLRAIHRQAAPSNRMKPRVSLVHDGARLLESYPEAASSYAGNALSDLGIDVILNHRVPLEQAADLPSASALAPALVWANGRRAPRLATFPGLADGCLDDDLSVKGHPEILAIGDLAVSNAGARIPGLASAALQMGRHAAGVIWADLSRRTRPTFSYVEHGHGTYVGPQDAVVVLGQRVLTGAAAFAAKMSLHMALSTASSLVAASTTGGAPAIRRGLAPQPSRGLVMLDRTPPEAGRRTTEVRLESRIADRTPDQIFDVAMARVDQLFTEIDARVLERVATPEGQLRLRIQLDGWRTLHWPIELAFDRSNRVIVITTLATHPLRARATIQVRPRRGGAIITQVNQYQRGVATSLLGKAVGLDDHLVEFWRGFHDALGRAAR